MKLLLEFTKRNFQIFNNFSLKIVYASKQFLKPSYETEIIQDINKGCFLSVCPLLPADM